jgi:RES domain
MGGRGRRFHDKDVLDALEAIGAQPFDGQVWRVTRSGRDPARGSAASGRWSPPGEFEVLYTSLERDGALAEIGHRLSLEPVWPSKLVHELHELTIHAGRAVRLLNLQTLETLGVNTARYEKYDYSATQAIAAAAQFLGFDALIVPNARHPGLNLVGLLENLDPGAAVEIVPSEIVDWSDWRRKGQAQLRATSSQQEGSPEEGKAAPIGLEQLPVVCRAPKAGDCRRIETVFRRQGWRFKPIKPARPLPIGEPEATG